MFTYVTKTQYNYDRIYSFTFPVEHATDRLSFSKYYRIRDEAYYQANHFTTSLSSDNVSQYSVTFIDSNHHAIQTNHNLVIDMYSDFSDWDPRRFNKVSVPPRSRLYLFKHKNAEGKYYTFENNNDSSQLHSIELSVDDDVTSMKWVTKFPVKNMYVLDENKTIYRPIYEGSGFDLSSKHTELNEPLFIPLYKFDTMPYKYSKINNLYNH